MKYALYQVQLHDVSQTEDLAMLHWLTGIAVCGIKDFERDKISTQLVL